MKYQSFAYEVSSPLKLLEYPNQYVLYCLPLTKGEK